jgi:FlaA1/EpsC-like NDP-sugar epimerase
LVGIREGEKLHECMITSADARTTHEYADHYVIYPQYNWWNMETDIIAGGRKVKPDWEYTSDKNDRWLGVDELRILLKEV